MKTTIEITGSGINSKNILRNAICTYNSTIKNLNFNNYALVFPTKKEAIKALSNAFQNLKSDKEDWNASMVSYTRGHQLNYDAGTAKII